MEHYRKSSHTTYDIKYHLVWITKYRKRVLTGEIAKRARELIREICRGLDVEIIIEYGQYPSGVNTLPKS